jgi:hypothetical protein
METPAPVNLNALKGILANAKKVMNKVEENSTPKGGKQPIRETYDDAYSNQPMYNEMDEREPVYEQYTQQTPSAMQPMNYTAEQVMNSNLPANIKEAMLKNPIPQLQGPPSKFSLEDLGDLVEKPKSRQPIRENASQHNSQGMMVDPNMLKAMIKEAVAEYFKESYEKQITEQAIKKTINVLIKEGKINTKK